MSALARFPFSAVVGQSEARLALLLAAVDPGIGGVLLRGDKGSAKSTLARGLAGMLPGGAPFVELPLGATEDRVLGTIESSAAPGDGGMPFRPGLLAAAHGGVLYVDEVNLLPDPLVDVLLDVAASGINRVERNGLSHSHPARFLLVGSMNPEEGELRPQLLDRFGLSVEVKAPNDPQLRAEIVRRRLTHDAGGRVGGGEGDIVLRARLAAAMPADLPDTAVDFACRLAVSVGAEGLRADLVLCRAAAAFAGWEGRSVATSADVERVAAFALGHRRRRRPFDPPVLSDGELERALTSARQSFADAYSQITPPAAEPPVEAEPALSTVAPDTAAVTDPPVAVRGDTDAVADGVDIDRPRGLEDDPSPASEDIPDAPDLPDLPPAPGPSPWAGVTIGAPRDDDPVDDLPNDEVPVDDLPNDEVPNDDLPNDDLPNDDLPNDDLPNGGVPNDDLPEDDTAGDDLTDDIASGPNDELPDDGERSEDLTDPGADVPSGVAGHDDDSRGHVHLADDSAGPAAPGGQHDVTLPATAGAATVDDDPGAAGPADDGPGGSAPLGWTPAPADDRAGARHDLPVRPRTAGGIALAESVVRAGPHHDDVATDVAPDVAAAPVGARGEVPLRPRPRGRTVVIAVDASGSAGTHRRVEAATGAVLALLADAYLRRDRVSLVTFRGDTAEVVLPPTASVELARTRLAEVPTGGVTPLAEGINAGLSLARAAQADGWPPLLVLVTDGQATGHRSARERADAAAAEVAEAGMDVVVVDAEHGPQRLDLAEELASTMRGRCVRPDDLSAAAIESAVRDALR